MRTFVEMGKFIKSNVTILGKLYEHELKFLERDNNFDKIFSEFQVKRNFCFEQSYVVYEFTNAYLNTDMNYIITN